MSDLLVRLWRLYHTPQGKRMFRYTMVSVISTLVSVTVLGLVYGVFQWWTEVPSTLFANVAATIPSYYLNRSWVWGKSGRSHLVREVLPFWALSFAGMVLSIFTSTVARNIGLAHFPDHHVLRTMLVLVANLMAFGVLWIVKFLVFNKLFHVSPVDQDADLVDAVADAG